MAPRKHRQPSHQHNVSDIDLDSDAHIVPQAVPSAHPLPVRTNDELNLAVLKRHNSEVASILSIGAYSVLYQFSATSHVWEKSGIEGTLFVCQLIPTEKSGPDRYTVFVLNRRGLENFQLELKNDEDVDVTDEYIILMDSAAVNESTGESPPAIHGLWIFAEEPPSSTAEARTLNARVIKDCAMRAEASRRYAAGEFPPYISPLISNESVTEAQPEHQQNGQSTEASVVPGGRQVLLSELFQNSHVPPSQMPDAHDQHHPRQMESNPLQFSTSVQNYGALPSQHFEQPYSQQQLLVPQHQFLGRSPGPQFPGPPPHFMSPPIHGPPQHFFPPNTFSSPPPHLQQPPRMPGEPTQYMQNQGAHQIPDALDHLFSNARQSQQPNLQNSFFPNSRQAPQSYG